MQPPTARAASGARDDPPCVTRDIVAEAAVWLARLHGPDRSRSMERECLAWQSLSSAHRLAFERCTDTWQDIAGVTLSSYATSANADRGRRARRLPGWRWMSAVVAVSAAAMALTHVCSGDDTYASKVGEQRIVALPDGSRMSLNTATRVRVDFTTERRTVKVVEGEVLFEVAKDSRRPFLVQVAGTEVAATGTEFLVRYSLAAKPDDALAVTLVEGQVIVRGVDGRATPSLAMPLVMQPGEQLRIGRSATPAAVRLAAPRIDQALAWRRGMVVFDDVTLREAAVEMNRYSSKLINVDAKEIGHLRVSGSFRAGDSVGFARALAVLHGLVVRAHGDQLELEPK